MLFNGFTSVAQTNTFPSDSIKNNSNPIIFAELLFGYSNGDTGGWTGGASLNYQFKNNLFTLRTLGFSELRYEGKFIIIPFYTTIAKLEEYALMYGKRNIDEDSSFSYSAGISIIKYSELDEPNSIRNNLKYIEQNFIGIPIECNIKWFKSNKERYRIYGLIPVGKPVAFGNSFGFKAFANISKKSFVGIALIFGIGYHKNY